jgi:hypothetical protein
MSKSFFANFSRYLIFVSIFSFVLFILGIGFLYHSIHQIILISNLNNSDDVVIGTIAKIKIYPNKDKFIEFYIDDINVMYKGKLNFRKYKINIGEKLDVVFDKEQKNYILKKYIDKYYFDIVFILIFSFILIVGGILLIIKVIQILIL